MRRSPIPRRIRIRPINPERRARLFARNFHSEAFVRWTHRQPCIACGARRFIHCAHVRSRGAGGTWRDIVPLCESCHRAQEAAPGTFWSDHHLDGAMLAAAHALRWDQILESEAA